MRQRVKMAATITTLFTPAHVRYCIFHLTQPLPSDYLSADPHRASVVYFALNALDVMGALSYLSDDQRRAIVAWLHDSPLKAFLRPTPETAAPTKAFNVAMVYAAIASLVMLGDDLERIDRDAVRAALPTLQIGRGSVDTAFDGAVMAYGPGGEADVRYVYSAAAVAALLDLWPDLDERQPFDVAAAAAFCMRSQAHDGGFGLCPGNESHGGSTFCATAALALLGQPLRTTARPASSSAAVERVSFSCSITAAAGGAGGAARVPCSCSACASSTATDPRWYCCPSGAASAGSSSSGSFSAGLQLHRWLALRQRDLALADECELDGEMAVLFRGCCVDDSGGSGGAAGGAAAGGAGSAAKPEAKPAASKEDEHEEDEDEEEEEEPDVNDRVMLAGPGGLTGRPGKPSDVCYTYWVTAAMAALTHGQSKLASTADASAGSAAGCEAVVAKGSDAPAGHGSAVPAALSPPGVDGFAGEHVASFVLSCQHLRSGGFGKDGESLPDPMHTHYALAGLALLGFPGLRKVDPLLAITERAAAHLRTLHASWAAATADRKTA